MQDKSALLSSGFSFIGPIYDTFADGIASVAQQLLLGNPEDPANDIGPMISRAAAERAEQWVREALNGGARARLSGRRHGAVVLPWLIDQVPHNAKIMAEEMFAPIATMIPYDSSFANSGT